MYLRDFFALKPFHDYSLCSVCILPQPAFYSQSAVCILHSVCILPLVHSLQSAVRSLRFTLTGFLDMLLETCYSLGIWCSSLMYGVEQKFFSQLPCLGTTSYHHMSPVCGTCRIIAQLCNIAIFQHKTSICLLPR